MKWFIYLIFLVYIFCRFRIVKEYNLGQYIDLQYQTLILTHFRHFRPGFVPQKCTYSETSWVQLGFLSPIPLLVALLVLLFPNLTCPIVPHFLDLVNRSLFIPAIFELMKMPIWPELANLFPIRCPILQYSQSFFYAFFAPSP